MNEAEKQAVMRDAEDAEIDELEAAAEILANLEKSNRSDAREIARGFRAAFDMMEVAEEEIEKAQQRHPDQVRRINDAFNILEPPTRLPLAVTDIYRHHCRELLERVAHDADTQLATTAEICRFLSDTSLMAPPERDHAALYVRLFKRMFPKVSLPLEDIDQSYPGAVDELEARYQRKLRVEGRRL